MATTAYFDCFSGASGDMVLGALIDVGLPIDSLRDALGSLAIEYGEISAARVLRAGISATKFQASAGSPEGDVEPHAHGAAVHVHDGGASDHEHVVGGQGGRTRTERHQHHTLKEIATAIGRSALSAAGKARAVELFERLAATESAIHDVPADRIHLHEVGALDSVIDIVGAVHGMEWLGVDEVVVSPMNVGSGTVVCEHGEFPVPAPATVRLLEGVPIYAGAVAEGARHADRCAADDGVRRPIRAAAGDARAAHRIRCGIAGTFRVTRTCFGCSSATRRRVPAPALSIRRRSSCSSAR